MASSSRPKMSRKQSFLNLFNTPLTPPSPLTPQSVGSPRDPVVLSRADTSACPLCGVHSPDSPAFAHAHMLAQERVDTAPPTPSESEEPHSYRRKPKPTVSQKRTNELNHLALHMAPLTLDTVRAETTSTRVASPPTPPTSTALPTPIDPSQTTAELPRIPSLTISDLSASTGSIASTATTIMGSLIIQAPPEVIAQHNNQNNGGTVSGEGTGGSDGTSSGGADEAGDPKPRLVHINSRGQVESVWSLAYGADSQLRAALLNVGGSIQILPSSMSTAAIQSANTSSMESAQVSPMPSPLSPSASTSGTSIRSSTAATPGQAYASSTAIHGHQANVPAPESTVSVYSSATPSVSAAHQIQALTNKAQSLLVYADELKLQLAERKKEDVSGWSRDLTKEWEKESRRLKREMRAAEQEADDWFAAVHLLRAEGEESEESD